MSVAKGFDKAIDDAVSIGCTSLQIFTKSNRQWKARPISEEEAFSFRDAVKNSSIKKEHIFVHASYLINLGSTDQKLETQSVSALAEELNRCALLGISYLVLHPGSHGTSDPQDCLIRIAKNLDRAIEKSMGKTMILLENMAGQGTTVGSSFENLAFILSHVQHKALIGFCFDTCHAFAAGYDFRESNSYETLWKTYDTIIGLEKLKLIHLNDSKKGLACHIDRHESIGKGALGLEPFRLLCNDQTLLDVPKILETPKESLEDDRANIQTVISLLKNDWGK